MSHDRGCPCGKEPYEYNDCTTKDCYKKEKLPKTQQTEKKYILITQTGTISLLENEDALIRSANSNLRTECDCYYEIGSEVKLKNTIQRIKRKHHASTTTFT